MKKVRRGVPLDLEKRNRWFDNLSPARKKMEIAREVIWALEAEHFEVASGYTVIASQRALRKGSDLQPIFEVQVMQKNGVKCTGCAIAGMFFGAVRLGDKAKVPYSSSIYCTDMDQGEIHEELEYVFSKVELMRIETAFEQREYVDSSDLEGGEKELMALVNYRMRLNLHHIIDRPDALKCICQNIIDNKGRFVVEY